MTTTEDLKTLPLTERDAGFLTQLARAASNYNRALDQVAFDVAGEKRQMAEGFRASGIGAAQLVEVATKHAVLAALLDAGAGYDGELERSVWQELLLAAYKGDIVVFRPAE